MAQVNPTGTAHLQNALAIGIRKFFRERQKAVLEEVKNKQYHIERHIMTEAALDINAMDMILNSFSEIDVSLRPLIFGFIAASWKKGSVETEEIIKQHVQPDLRMLGLMQANTLSYVTRFAGEQKDRLRSILSSGVSQGDSISTIASEIRDAFKVTSWRSETIARSEIVRTYNVGTAETMKSGGVHKYEWVTSIKPNSGKVDIALNGRVFDLRSKGTMVIAGKRISKSPMPVTSTHPNCKCRIRPRVI